MISSWSYSQSLQVVENDTVAVVPMKLIRKANILFIEGEFCKRETELLRRRISAISAVEMNLNSIIEIQSQMHANDSISLEALAQAYRASEKEVKKQRRLKNTSVFVGVGLILMALVFR